MVFNDFNKIDFYRIHPNTGIDLKTLTEIEQEEYIELCNAYRKLLTEVIIKRFKLKELDETFSNSDLCFVPNDSKMMDCYQWFLSDELKYFYLRNNVYIERLSDDDKEYLRNIVELNDYSITDEVEQFIEKTYLNVIKEDVKIKSDNDKKTFVLYGPDNKNYLVPNESIVIGFNYDEFAENGLDDNEWNDRHKKQITFMCNTLNASIDSLNNISKIPVIILKYNEYSIIKRKSD